MAIVIVTEQMSTLAISWKMNNGDRRIIQQRISNKNGNRDHWHRQLKGLLFMGIVAT